MKKGKLSLNCPKMSAALRRQLRDSRGQSWPSFAFSRQNPFTCFSNYIPVRSIRTLTSFLAVDEFYRDFATVESSVFPNHCTVTGLAFFSLRRRAWLAVQTVSRQEIFGAQNGCDTTRSRYLPAGNGPRSNFPSLSVLNSRTALPPFSSSSLSPGIGNPAGSLRMLSNRCVPSVVNGFDVLQSAATARLASSKIAHSPKTFMLVIVDCLDVWEQWVKCREQAITRFDLLTAGH